MQHVFASTQVPLVRTVIVCEDVTKIPHVLSTWKQMSFRVKEFNQVCELLIYICNLRTVQS